MLGVWALGSVSGFRASGWHSVLYKIRLAKRTFSHFPIFESMSTGRLALSYEGVGFRMSFFKGGAHVVTAFLGLGKGLEC